MGDSPLVLILIFLIVNFIFLVGNTSFFMRKDSDVTGELGIPPVVVNLAVITVKASLPRATIDIATSLIGGGRLTIDGIMNSGVFGLVMIIKIYSVLAPVLMRGRAVQESVPFSVVYTLLLLKLKVLTTKSAVKVELNRLSKVVLLKFFTNCVIMVVRDTVGTETTKGGISVRKVRRLRRRVNVLS